MYNLTTSACRDLTLGCLAWGTLWQIIHARAGLDTNAHAHGPESALFYKLASKAMIVFAVRLSGLVCAAGITSTPLFDKTDKTKPMGAFVSTLNPLVGQPEERGASPLLYAAASPELDGTPRVMAPIIALPEDSARKCASQGFDVLCVRNCIDQ